jgi:hypothetical protein
MWSIYLYVYSAEYTRHLGDAATELGRWKDGQAPNEAYGCITYASGGEQKEDFENSDKNEELYRF